MISRASANFYLTNLELMRKRLFVDIETSPNVGLFWEAGYKKNIPYDNITEERVIICICYKWEGAKRVYALTWDNKQCDKKMLKEFVLVLKEADEIVGHNGDRYDISFVRTRCVIHRISMPPKYQTIDTLKVARSKFKFNSNRLDYIAFVLGLGRKIETKFDLWKELVLKNSKPALREMVKYCKKDVILLEDVFTVLKTHIEPKINYPALYNSDRSGCPECGSDNLNANGTRSTLHGTIKREYRCKDCGKYHLRVIK